MVTEPDRPRAPRRRAPPTRGSAGWGAFLTSALVLVLACPDSAGAAVLRVPEEHATAAAAVRAAAHRDTILFAPGTHAGGVFVDGKALTLASRFLLSGDTALVAATVLRGAADDMCAGRPGCVGRSVVEFGASAHGGAVVGLTVTGGEDGVRSQARVEIAHCRVVENGDGVDFVSGSGGTLRNSLFARNRDDGIDLNGRIEARIVDNDIRDNRQDGVEYRLHAYRGPVQTIEFTGNRITGNGSDGIQLIDYPDVSDRVVRIERNLFRANRDAAIGCLPDGRTIQDFGGAAVAERVFVVNNTFLDERHGVIGGANTVIVNNVFSGVRGSALRRVGGRSVVAHNLFWETRTELEECGVTATAHRRADPRLDAAGRPRAGSAAIDGGTASFVARGDTLLALPPGSFHGAAPDLGAFESGAEPGAGSPARGR